MLRSAGRRGLVSVGNYCASVSRILSRNWRCDGGSVGDPNARPLGLGFMGSVGQQQARPFMRGVHSLIPGAATKVVAQDFKSEFLTGRLGYGYGAGFKVGVGGVNGAFQLSQARGFIQLRTNLEVADNSGARRVQCIKVMKGSNAAKIGDIIMASVKDAQPRGKVKKGEVVTCVVVRAATQKLRRDGSEIRFDKNAVVLINKQGEPIGTRIFGPVPHELRRRKLVKILTLAEYVA
ncbi:unnamed protein product [Calypogeia fissa]